MQTGRLRISLPASITQSAGGEARATSIDSVNFQFHNLRGGEIPYAAFAQPAQVRAVDALNLESDQVALAVLEVDGSISCLKYDEINPNASTLLARRRFIQKKQ